MIFPGQILYITVNINCPQCSQPMSVQTTQESAFWIASCQNRDCDHIGIQLVIEKKTNSVIFVSARFFPDKETGEWRPVYPMLADKDGKQVWPEQK